MPTTDEQNKLAVGVEEAARLLSCRPGSIRKFIRQRRLPRLAGFRKILIPVSAIQELVKSAETVN